MGNMALAREDARDVWIAAVLDRVWRDVKYGVRGLRREPMFAFTACVTLAAGMAIATTVFSVVDAELWKPLPFPAPDQLVAVNSRDRPARVESIRRVAGADWLDWRAQSQRSAVWLPDGDVTRRVLHRDSAESVRATHVTPNYFSVLGGPMLIGRGLDDGGLWRPRRRSERTPLATAVQRRSRGPGPQRHDRRSIGRDRGGPARPARPSGRMRTSSSRWIPVLHDFRDRAAGPLRRPAVFGRASPPRPRQPEMDAIVERIARQFPEGRAGHKGDCQRSQVVRTVDLAGGPSTSSWAPPGS